MKTISQDPSSESRIKRHKAHGARLKAHGARLKAQGVRRKIRKRRRAYGSRHKKFELKKRTAEYQIMNVEYRRNVFCLFLLLKKRLSEAKQPFDTCPPLENSSFEI